MFASVGGRGRSQITPGVPRGENRRRLPKSASNVTRSPVVIDGIPSHLAIRFAGKPRGSGAEHIERERGFRPDRNGDAQVLIE
jgi:hypothetical protein